MTISEEPISPERKRWPEPPKDGWYAVGWGNELPPGKILSVKVFSISYALFRNSEGQVRALLDQCPHRLAPLSSGTCRGGKIQCPYHGWEFSEHGELIDIPSFLPGQKLPIAHVTSYEVKEEFGVIWLSLNKEDQPSNSLPGFVNKSHGGRGIQLTVDLEGELLFAIENFLDATHTHFVHNKLIRSDQQRTPTHVEISRLGNEVVAEYGEQKVSKGMITKFLAMGNESVSSSGRFIYPSIARLEYVTNRNWSMSIAAAFTPTTAGRIRVYVLVSYRPNVPLWLSRLIILPFFKLATKQDKWIVKLQAVGASGYLKGSLVSTSHDVMFPHIVAIWRRKAADAAEVKISSRIEMNL